MSLEGAPELSPPRPQRSRAPLIIGVAVLVLALAGGAYFLWGRGKSDSKSLVRGIPNGVAGVVGLNIKVVLEHDKIKPLIARPEVQAGLAKANEMAGVDVMALQSVAAGLQLIDNEFHVLAVIKGGFNVDKLNALFTTFGLGTPIEIKGKKLVKVAMADLPIGGFGPRRKHKFDEPKLDDTGAGDSEDGPKTDTADATDATDGTDSADAPPGTASVVAPKPPFKMPGIADMALGALDDKTFVVGSPTLIEKFLDGTDTVANDPDIGPLIKEVSDDAVYWGISKFKADSAEGKLVLGFAETLPGPLATMVPAFLKDSVVFFELRLAENLEGRFISVFGSEDSAKTVKEFIDTFLPMASEQLKAVGGKVEAKLEGAKLTVTLSIPVPDLEKLAKGGL